MKTIGRIRVESQTMSAIKTLYQQIFVRPKYDGVVDAVHYTTAGQVDWVRAYERRGPTWSDLVLLDRETLIARIQAGKRFYSGARHPYMASEFDINLPIRLEDSPEGPRLISGDMEEDSQGDLLGEIAEI